MGLPPSGSLFYQFSYTGKNGEKNLSFSPKLGSLLKMGIFFSYSPIWEKDLLVLRKKIIILEKRTYFFHFFITIFCSVVHIEEPPQNPNKSPKKMLFFHKNVYMNRGTHFQRLSFAIYPINIYNTATKVRSATQQASTPTLREASFHLLI